MISLENKILRKQFFAGNRCVETFHGYNEVNLKTEKKQTHEDRQEREQKKLIYQDMIIEKKKTS